MNRKNLKIGDVLLINYPSFIQKIIQFLTLGKYTHAVCYIGDDQIIESDWGGVKISSIDSYPEYDVYRHKTASDEDLEVATQWMLSQLGSPYDYLGLLGAGWNLLGFSKVNELDEKSCYWCSELIADGYIKTEIETDFDKNTWSTSPNDFARSKYFDKVGE